MNSDRLRAPSTRYFLATFVIAAAAGAVFLWPAMAPWHAILGDPTGESDNHLWMLWRARQRVLGDVRLLVNAPEQVKLPLMDPVNLPAYLAGALISPQLGLYLVAMWNVALAMAGGWLLSREVAGPRAAWVGMVATGSAPFLAGVIDFGLTESWTIGWLALHAGFLLRHGRTGKWWQALAAGVCLGGVGLSGWYNAFFGLIVEAALVPFVLARHQRPGTVLQGLIGLGMVWPAFLRFLEVRERWGPRWLAPPKGPYPWRPNWGELPIFGTDLLNFVVPRVEAVEVSKSVYLGVVVVALAGLGLLRRRRDVLPMVAAAAPLLLLALGYWPTIAGHPLGVPGLAYGLVKALPDLQGLSHWHRAVGPAVPFVAAAAAAGVDALPGRRWLAPLLCGVVLVDSVAFSQTHWPRTAYEPETPEVLLELASDAGLQPGMAGIVQLPFDNGRVPFSTDPARLYNRWQVFHGHPVSENYEGVDALLARSRLIAVADEEAGVRSTLPPYYKAPPDTASTAGLIGEGRNLAVVQGEVERLRSWGYRWIVLDRARARTPWDTIRFLDAALGPGRQVPGAVIWDLDEAAATLADEARGGATP